MDTSKKLEELICQAKDINGMCRFNLKQCDEVSIEECPNTTERTLT